jgi:dTDP-glucose 4,6-dehydratase
VTVTNCSNNYGPFQFPEKLVPLMILNALEGKPLPVYGDGLNVRDWLYVGDHCSAIWTVMNRGVVGRVYCVGGRCEKPNLEVVHRICDAVDQLAPGLSGGRARRELITYVKDRPGHDRRYAIDCTRIEQELGWRQSETFDSGFEKTVRWYLDNPAWVEGVRSGAYRQWIDQNYTQR